ncbi:hypothetical protein GCM10022393_04650 [Aquimarina addita]|uniref:RNA polymerase sigma-70 region 2 domain-containing protein n=1 Tax=Aquimarina addita TaxID=870485 RepID=A0ABP7X9P3_9FLAO
MGYVNEIKIFNGIIAGDQKILNLFYEKNFTTVHSFIIQNSGNESDSEDIFQDGFIILYKQLKSDSFHIDCSIHTYFYGICKNVWMNRLRRKFKVICCGAIDKLIIKIEQQSVDLAEIDEKELLYRKHFLKLTCKCKEVLTSFFDGKSMKETALAMQCSEGYARKNKFECKKNLIQMIENDPVYKELALISKSDDVKKIVI